MAFLEWNSSFLVNIKEIDEQHENLFKTINDLHNSLKIGEGEAFIKPILNSLVKEVIIHFQTEEKWMKKYHYPELQQHYQEHQAYISEIKGFIIKNKKRTPLLARDLLLSLGPWYRKHITEYDKKFGKFLEEKNIKLNDK